MIQSKYTNYHKVDLQKIVYYFYCKFGILLPFVVRGRILQFFLYFTLAIYNNCAIIIKGVSTRTTGVLTTSLLSQLFYRKDVFIYDDRKNQ